MVQPEEGPRAASLFQIEDASPTRDLELKSFGANIRRSEEVRPLPAGTSNSKHVVITVKMLPAHYS